MLYLAHKPGPPLDRFVRSLWYASIPSVDHRRERILPTGQTQVILSLARDFLLDCPENAPAAAGPAAQVVGGRSVHEIIDTSDLACLIGIVFLPGGFPPFAAGAADQFTNRSVNLEAVWGMGVRALRDRLRELRTPKSRLGCVEAFLIDRLSLFPGSPTAGFSPAVRYALRRFHELPGAAVRDVARETGWSERRFSQVFREHVGFSPSVWRRILRFQRAVRRLHIRPEIPLAELAVDCGYYDQSHFANDFKSFAGIDATTYMTARSTPWANHVRSD